MIASTLFDAIRSFFDIGHEMLIVDRFSVDDDSREYETSLSALMFDVWSGRIDADQFAEKHKRLLETMGLAMLASGLLAAGVSIDQVDAAMAGMEAYLNDWIAGQSEYVDSFARDVLAARDNLSLRMEIYRRAALWVEAMRGMANIAGAMTRLDEMLTFSGEDGAESCDDCQKMKGVRKPASWWINNNMIPGVIGTSHYRCHGYYCQHHLRNDAGVYRLP